MFAIDMANVKRMPYNSCGPTPEKKLSTPFFPDLRVQQRRNQGLRRTRTPTFREVL